MLLGVLGVSCESLFACRQLLDADLFLWNVRDFMEHFSFAWYDAILQMRFGLGCFAYFETHQNMKVAAYRKSRWLKDYPIAEAAVIALGTGIIGFLLMFTRWVNI